MPLRRTDRSCDGLSPVLRGRAAASPDRPCDGVRRPYGAGRRMRRIRRPCDRLRPALRGRMAAAPDRKTAQRPPASPTERMAAAPHDQPCDGLPPLLKGRSSIRRPHDGPVGPGGGCAGSTDPATASSRPYAAGRGYAGSTDRATASCRRLYRAGWRLRRTDQPCDCLPPALRAGWRLRRTDRSCDGLPAPLRGRLAAAPHRPTVRRLPPFPRCGWRLCRTDRQCDGLMPALLAGGGCAASTDRAMASRRPRGAAWRMAGPTDRATASRRRRGTGWRLCRTDRLCDGLPPPLLGRVAAVPHEPTVRRPPAVPAGPGGGCAGPIERTTAS